MPGRGHRLAPLVFLFVACVWLNQSVPVEAWRVVQARVWKTHEASWLETVRYPFVFLYRRSGDEELYHSVARSLRGQEPDRVFMRTARRHSGPDFERELPAADGSFHAPYTEVPFEYPPASLPFVLWPAYVTRTLQAYCVVFDATMGLLLALATWIVHRALRWDAAQRARGWWLGTAALLLHGSIAVQRLDAVVALALALALLAWTRGHLARLGAALGLAAALKLVPLLLIAVLPRARRVLGAALGVAAAGMGAFALFGPSAFGVFWRYHQARGLHCESVAATLLAIVRAPFAPLAPASVSYGSFNLNDPMAHVVAQLLGPLALLAFGALAVWTARRARLDAHVPLLVAGLCVMWLTGKVLSPQYLTWLVPLFAALPTRGRPSALVCAGIALLLSQVYFRAYFDAVYGMTALGTGTLLLRDLALVGLLWRCLQAARAEPTLTSRVRVAARSVETASARPGTK